MKIPATVEEYKAALREAAMLTGSVFEGAKLIAIEECLSDMRKPMTDAEALASELRIANIMINGAPRIPAKEQEQP